MGAASSWQGLNAEVAGGRMSEAGSKDAVLWAWSISAACARIEAAAPTACCAPTGVPAWCAGTPSRQVGADACCRLGGWCAAAVATSMVHCMLCFIVQLLCQCACSVVDAAAAPLPCCALQAEPLAVGHVSRVAARFSSGAVESAVWTRCRPSLQQAALASSCGREQNERWQQAGPPSMPMVVRICHHRRRPAANPASLERRHVLRSSSC